MKKRGFTLIELLVVISVIAILLAILMPALNKAQEFGKRLKCLANLKNLAIAWTMYSDSNNDKICSGRFGTANNSAPAWCGDASVSAQYSKVARTEVEQLAAIKTGVLFTYINNYGAYRCSTAVKGEFESYAVFDGMNGEAADLAAADKADRSIVCVTKSNVKRASTRLVFVDEGYITPSSFAVRYRKEWWYDQPSIRHGKGSTFSYADTHAEFYKWAGRQTIANGKTREGGAGSTGGWELNQTNSQPKNSEDQRDLQYVQKGCYGLIGYTPSML
jgi:prepilin-type N-terminal cleavage/methylation domain-containing protein/prepilin-type processing-associated H-X9-DG protein